MAQAKSKAVVLKPYEDRMKEFEKRVIELVKELKVGIQPMLASDHTKIMAILSYVDLAEVEKKDEKANDKTDEKEGDKE